MGAALSPAVCNIWRNVGRAAGNREGGRARMRLGHIPTVMSRATIARRAGLCPPRLPGGLCRSPIFFEPRISGAYTVRRYRRCRRLHRPAGWPRGRCRGRSPGPQPRHCCTQAGRWTQRGVNRPRLPPIREGRARLAVQACRRHLGGQPVRVHPARLEDRQGQAYLQAPVVLGPLAVLPLLAAQPPPEGPPGLVDPRIRSAAATSRPRSRW
jgi:hypothetical protein